jgi:hypothetical protein
MLILLSLLFSFQVDIYTLQGKWQAPELDNSVLQFYAEKNGLLYGKIIESENPEVENKIVITNLSYNLEKGEYTGIITHPTTNISADITIEQVSKNELKVVAKKWFLTKTFKWKKI